MRILYFAWLKTRTGVGAEEVSPPDHVRDVDALVAWLKERSPGHAKAFEDLSAVRVAVNQEFVRRAHPLQPGDEVAFFPPVTGG